MAFSLTDQLLNIFRDHPGRNAFYIQGNYYTYADFFKRIVQIEQIILQNTGEKEMYLGLFSFDDLDTYASIYACWFLGRAFVPLNPLNPSERNNSIIRQTEIRTCLHSQKIPAKALDPAIKIKKIDSKKDMDHQGEIIHENVDDEQDMYVLFTSGSTGEPKGVPISRINLNSFVEAYLTYPSYHFTPEDRFLQMYDISFDASIPCYVVPLCAGASVYTVPQHEIKYLYAYRLMKEKNLTFLKMAPSTLSFLRPYFKSIKLDHPRYCILGGEAVSSKLVEAWSSCVPNALIQNIYGPTETTVNCLVYEIKGTNFKENDGIVSLGQPFGENITVVMDKKGNILPAGKKGELCIGGPQVARGYWKDKAKTSKVFIEKEYDGQPGKFYRTGDLAYQDENGDYMFCGRMDNQIQIRGYRVELGEIEKHGRDFLNIPFVVAIGYENKSGTIEIYLFIEKTGNKTPGLQEYLANRLPSYMMPKKYIFLAELPRLSSGKINRKMLINYIDDES